MTKPKASRKVGRYKAISGASAIAIACLLSNAAEARVIAITGVNVIPMTSNIVLRDMTVILDGKKIVDVVRPKAAHIPRDALVIPAGGKYLIPGLADMHVHIGFYLPVRYRRPDFSTLETPVAPAEWKSALNNELLLYLAYGVTTVRNMAGNATVLSLSKSIEQQSVLGPHIYSTTPIIDGLPVSSPDSFAYATNSPADAEHAVDVFYNQGYRSVKVYNQMHADVYAVIVAAARKHDMTVVGHVPFAVGLDGVLAAHQYSIEHLRGYENDPLQPPKVSLSVDRFKAFARIPPETMKRRAMATAEAGVWNDPTLVVSEEGSFAGVQLQALETRNEEDPISAPLREELGKTAFPPEIAAAVLAAKAPRERQVDALYVAGAKLLAGTDTPLDHVTPGRGLDMELGHLVEAGLSPYDALVCATINAQEFLGLAATRGKIAVGMAADLVILDANPLTDIRNIGRVNATIVDGRYFTEQELRLRLKDSQ